MIMVVFLLLFNLGTYIFLGPLSKDFVGRLIILKIPSHWNKFILITSQKRKMVGAIGWGND